MTISHQRHHTHQLHSCTQPIIHTISTERHTASMEDHVPPAIIHHYDDHAPLALHLYDSEHTRQFIERIRTIYRPHQSSRPRPLYNMPRGPSTLLSTSAYAKFYREDKEHPRVRLHEAANLLIQFFSVDCLPLVDLRPTKSSVPIRLRVLCDQYNRNYLNRTTDLQLSPICIWRLIHGRFIEKSALTSKPTSHHALYFQNRYPTPSESKDLVLKRRKALCTNQIGEDYRTIKNNTTIIHPPTERLMYLAVDLHNRNHGSSAVRDIESRSVVFDVLHIDHEVISPNNAGPDAIKTKNSITAAFSKNSHIQQIDRKLVGGLQRLHYDLTLYMLKQKGSDPSRAVEMTGAPSETSQNTRLRFGFGRIQKPSPSKVKWKVSVWKFKDLYMPTIDYKPFKKLPKSLRDDLITLFESGQRFALKHYDSPYNNPTRTEFFSKRMNRLLGYPTANFRFEYIDIVLSRNTALPKHIDCKNDHRRGYNFCVVYSFYCTIAKLEYKVSVIMCTRNAVGAAIESAMNSSKSK